MAEASSFPIIGVGASAGGVEALEGFFRGLPPDPGIALVVVTHLSPDRKSLLDEVLANFTELPVQVASDGMAVENNTVYVMPAGTIVEMQRRRLRLRNNAKRERRPIDIFLSSLAADVGELSGGVILSGGDADGTLGLKAIKERGGVTLAQVGDGFGPQHPEMPESAISSGLVDFSVPVQEMGPKLVEFVRSSALVDKIQSGGADSGAAEGFERALPEIYGLLRTQVGHDFSGYKSKTFVRRVLRRMQVTQLCTVEAYVERLRQDPQEVGALFRDLLINVTSFFRDHDAFDALSTLVIPKLFEGRGAEDTVRIWVPGCATGEEVYSIGILVREYMDRLPAAPRIQLFATDIDDRALAVARAARYPGPLLESVSPERRKRFFTPDGGSFVVSKDVRDMCIFSPHSVIRDPPFSRIDLISCRNLLIYFGVDVQSQVIPTFHYALRPDGYLFLGTAENVSQFDDLFVSLDKRNRIFHRRSDVAPAIRVPMLLTGLLAGKTSEGGARRSPLGGAALRQAVEQLVIERHAPPHVVINHDGDVVYFSTRTSKYLEPPAGAPTRQILTMAKKGLRLDLRAAFRECAETGRAATRDGIAIESEGDRIQLVNITVEPLNHGGGGDPMFVVSFYDHGSSLSQDEAVHLAHHGRSDVAPQAERDLRETRDRLQSVIEEYETALEELKSSNEELVSVNEEMQSTNEELEASKEELQSVNEELHTVNAELSNKIDALDRANNDLQNLFESTEVATVFLDSNLLIRSFTPPATRIFNMLPTDKGRPITDLSGRIDFPDFADVLRKVFAGAAAIERRIDSTDHGSHYLARLAPYRDGEQKVEGVVITLVDISSLTRAEARQNMLVAELQHRTRNLLALVQSIASRTLGRGGTLEAFSSRLASLGRVQSLVSEAKSDRVGLREVVRLELDAICAPEGKVSITGPDVALGFELVQSIGLAVHELATNAVKYGALKQGAGHIDVSWSLRADPPHETTLVLDWHETGVPGVSEPTKSGFGRELIEKALTFTFRAKTKLSFAADGVSCHLEVPLPANDESSTPKP